MVRDAHPHPTLLKGGGGGLTGRVPLSGGSIGNVNPWTLLIVGSLHTRMPLHQEVKL
jgi:hypothetical protein